jgi:salicylate hydroxylase
MHRGDLHAMLVGAVRALKPHAIHVSAKCVGFAQDGEGVELLLEGATRVRGDVLIGADGVKSVVRSQLFGNDNPTFTGRLAWRGLVPIELLSPPLRRAVSTNWIGPQGSVTTYPVHKGELLNFVALVNREDWQIESWTAQGSRQECAHDLQGWHADVHEIIRNIEGPYKWGLFLREPLARWSIGRVTLLGDACHPMLPYLGQGANMAIEDGAVLARCLEACDDVDSALTNYEKARAPRAATVVERSTEQGRRVNRPELADADAAARYITAQWSDSSIAQWYDWIFDYDATATALQFEETP